MLKYLVLISFCLVIYYKTKKHLHMLQQNLYDENNRYLKWVLQNLKDFIDIDLLFPLISLLGIYITSYNSLIYNILFISLIILSLGLSIKLKNKLKNNQNKKPLVITARVKRLIFTTSFLFLIPTSVVDLTRDNQTIWLMLCIISLMIIFDNIVVLLSSFINYPYERCVYYHFKHLAQKKLKSMNNLKVIGITGSYGKTSSKNIISDILNVKYNALPTPRNLNTPNGLMITINNHLDKFTEIFIAEMGAYVKGEIKELCDFVHPKYGILTTIGTAHLETFGSEENIVKAKFELIESLPSDGFAVLNGDDSKQVSYKLQNKVKTIWIGINNKDVDVLATNIKCSNKGTTFDVKIR